MSWKFSLVILGLAALALVVMFCVVDHEAKKPKAKKNVRLPRTTSWDRVAEWRARRHG